MDASYIIILFLMLCCFRNAVFAQRHKAPEGLRVSRFHGNENICQYGWWYGFCRKRSECSKPTSQICNIGQNFDPVVCCLDTHEADPVKDIDLTYPGCGFRSPKIEGTRAQISNTRGRRRDPSFYRGKRSTLGGFPMIVGGAVSKENSWPWMVSLRRANDRQNWNHLCGASLISQNYILTAAHCFGSDTDVTKFSVVVGAHSRNDGTVYPVRQILIHPGYRVPLHYHDIALIAVERPVELSKTVYPVCLPTERLREKIERDNSNVTVTGWGHTSFGGWVSQELQEVTVPIIPLEECKESNGITENRPQGIIKQQICAGGQEDGKDACQEDSGGPLVSKLRDNSYVQLGIVSFGIGCGRPGYPGVYTRVSQYTKWIYDNTDLGK